MCPDCDIKFLGEYTQKKEKEGEGKRWEKRTRRERERGRNDGGIGRMEGEEEWGKKGEKRGGRRGGEEKKMKVFNKSLRPQ